MAMELQNTKNTKPRKKKKNLTVEVVEGMLANTTEAAEFYNSELDKADFFLKEAEVFEKLFDENSAKKDANANILGAIALACLTLLDSGGDLHTCFLKACVFITHPKVYESDSFAFISDNKDGLTLIRNKKAEGKWYC
jgi:hypothetical protein